MMKLEDVVRVVVKERKMKMKGVKVKDGSKR